MRIAKHAEIPFSSDRRADKKAACSEEARVSWSTPVELAVFAEKSPRAHYQDEVAVVSAAGLRFSPQIRAAGVKELNNILFYPVQYEVKRASGKRVLHGAARTSRRSPRRPTLQDEKVKRWCCAGPIRLSRPPTILEAT